MNIKENFNSTSNEATKNINNEKSKPMLADLISKNAKKAFGRKRLKESCLTCPDCGNALPFNSIFRIYMHSNSEDLNCWYQANEFGECVDNNQMRAERIAKFNGENFNEAKF